MSHELKTALTWVALVALSFLSIAVAGHSHATDQRSIMAVAVAIIAWVKGFMVIHQYLEARNAGRFFYGAMLTFNTLAPLALVVSAFREL
jgi:hypothetical protein